MGPSSHDKEKKSRWRSMLGGGHDSREDGTNHLRPGPSPKDSAYGSERTASEQPSTRPQSAEPSETKVKQDPNTGNIVTTTVTTTTTTTTVTTSAGEHIKTESMPTAEADATARIRNSNDATSTPAPANARTVHEQGNQADSGPASHRDNSGPGASGQAANVTNPAELDAPVPGAASADGNGPPIPVRSNRRISREMNTQPPRPISEVTEPPVSPISSPVSSSQHNFSYPARTPPHQEQQSAPGQRFYQDPKSDQGYHWSHGRPPSQGQQFHQGQPPHQERQGYQDQPPYLRQQTPGSQEDYQNQQPYQGQQSHQDQASHMGQNLVAGGGNRPGQRPGTFQNLKTAAAGIHGAGETLRGTLNSSIDRHVGHAPPETLATHERVVAAGNSEIETGRFYHDPAREQERVKGKGRFGGILRKPVGD